MARQTNPRAGTEKSCPTPRFMRLKPDFLQHSGINSVNTVYRLAAECEIRLVKQGRGTYVDMESYDAMIKRNRFTPERAEWADGVPRSA